MTAARRTTGSHLIFIASQPRTGSTLLQVLLSAHPEVISPNEIWLMLPLIAPLKPDFTMAEYDVALARSAIRFFMENSLGDTAAYDEAIRRAALYLYDAALERTDSTYLVDKTPRYYHILPELRRIFPDATIITLYRNPCAVLCSIIYTWDVEEKWHLLGQYRHDLFQAPELITGANNDNISDFVYYYEALLQDKTSISAVFHYLGLEMIEDLRVKSSIHRDGFGDPKIDQNDQLVPSKIDTWQEKLDNPQVWRLVDDYLDSLGPDLLANMGYDYYQLKTILADHRPAWIWRRWTLSLEWVITHTEPADYQYKPRAVAYRISRRIRRYVGKIAYFSHRCWT